MEHTCNNHIKLGQLGERLAARYLVTKGYSIVDRNVRIGRDEIDIIASRRDSPYIYIIEVKARRINRLDPAEYQFSRRKAINIRRAAQRYCQAHDLSEELIRTEYIAVNINLRDKMANIRHFINIM